MTRLAILDLSPAGKQPMSNADGTVWIVYNGETYNFREERSLLEEKGDSFTSAGDTQVVLRMYERYGEDFLSRLRGIFALAIYDKRRGRGRERLLLARDPLGIKPLLYAETARGLVFASELKALLASGLVDKQIAPESLYLLLVMGSIPQPRTILTGVQMLPPGHRLIVENGTRRLERYWRLERDRFQSLRTAPYQEQMAEAERVLRESISLQMASDVPLGAFLSGGVDSSIVVAMMAQAAGRRVKTFSVGFEAEGEAIDEAARARTTAEFLGTDHTHVLVRGNDVAEQIEQVAAALDQPSVDGVNSFFISKAACNGVTVALSGTGGDELFAGYPWFVRMALWQRNQEQFPLWKRVAKSAFRTLASIPPLPLHYSARTRARFAHIGRLPNFRNRYFDCYHIFKPHSAIGLLSPECRQSVTIDCTLDTTLKSADEVEDGSPFERVTGLCLRGYTCNQLLRDIDAVSMYHSLEVRVPYLDTELVDLALSLPDSAKIDHLPAQYDPLRTTYRQFGGKRILVDIGRKLLPKDFDVQPKRGFAMPFDYWLKGCMREILQDTLGNSSVIKRGLFDPQAVGRVRDDFESGRLGWSRPWLLMMTELWCRQVLDLALVDMSGR